MARQQQQVELRGAGMAVNSQDPPLRAGADSALFSSVSTSSASRVSAHANLRAFPLPCPSSSASSSRTLVAVTALPSVTADAAATAPACAQPVPAVPRGGSASSTLRSVRGAPATSSRGLSSLSSHSPSSVAASSRLILCHRGAGTAAVPASSSSLATAAASRSPSASAGAAALKLHHAQLSLLQTRDPYPLPRLPTAILDDETYSKTVSRIITRDYYPDLPMLRLLQQLFDAENRQDSTRAAQLLRRINMLTPASVRNGRHLSSSGASVVEAADPREALAAAAAARARKRSHSRCPDSASAVAVATQTASAAAGSRTAHSADSASVVASSPALPAYQGAAPLAQQQQQQSGPAVAGVEETAGVAAKSAEAIAAAASAREVPPTTATNTSAGSSAASSLSTAAAAAHYTPPAAAADDNPSLGAAAAAARGVETVAPVKIKHGGTDEEDERKEAAGRSLVSREYLVISSDESSSLSEDQTSRPSTANAGARGSEGRCKKRKAPEGYSQAAEPLSSDKAKAPAAGGTKGGAAGETEASRPVGAHEEDERAGGSCNPRPAQREEWRERVLSWRDRHRKRQQRQQQQPQRIALETDGPQWRREKGLEGQQEWQEKVKEEPEQHQQRRRRCCTPEDENQESVVLQQQLVDGLLDQGDSQESRGTLREEAGAAGRRRGGDRGSSDSRGEGAARCAAAAAPESREGKVAEETRRRRGAPDEDEEERWAASRRRVGDAAPSATCTTRAWGAGGGSTAEGLVGSTTETAGDPPLLTRLDNGMLHRVRTGLRLDAFLKRYSSEGTRSFWCLMKEERQQQRQHCWRQLAAQAQEQHNRRMVEIQMKTVRGESSTELAVGFINTQTNLFQKNAEVVPSHKQPHEERHEQHVMKKLAAAQEQERVAAAAARKAVDMRPWGGGGGARAAAAAQGAPTAAAAFQGVAPRAAGIVSGSAAATVERGDEQETKKGGGDGAGAAAAESGSASAYAADASLLQRLVPTTWAELLTTPALVAANSPCCTPVLGSSIYEPCPLNTFSSAAERAAAAFDLSTFHLPALRPSERALERLQQQAAARMHQQQNRRMEHVLGAQTSAALLASGTRHTRKSAVAAAQAAALLISKSRSGTSVYSSHR